MLNVIPDDRSKDEWIAATWKHAGAELKASGPTRVGLHRHVWPIGPRRRRQGRRSESKTLDDAKQTAN